MEVKRLGARENFRTAVTVETEIEMEMEWEESRKPRIVSHCWMVLRKERM